MTREEARQIIATWLVSSGYIEGWFDEEDVEALRMAIEALRTAEINCVHCPHYHETEDDTGVHSHCGSHGRLIDAYALDAMKVRRQE